MTQLDFVRTLSNLYQIW